MHHVKLYFSPISLVLDSRENRARRPALVASYIGPARDSPGRALAGKAHCAGFWVKPPVFVIGQGFGANPSFSGLASVGSTPIMTLIKAPSGIPKKMPNDRPMDVPLGDWDIDPRMAPRV